MDDIQNILTAIRGRSEKASPGPWRFINEPESIPCCNRIEHANGVICKGAGDISTSDISAEDGMFIAAARTDVIFLADKYLELAAEYLALQATYDKLVDQKTINLRLEI